jgi:branched-chain amino acid transport system ATP-binding protein
MLGVEGLVTYRGPAQVLRGIALAVGPAEAVCLVGRNGAGKTTTIESIMGLLPIRAGTVRLAGQDVSRLPAHERARRGIGYSPEDAGIFPELTVAENFEITRWVGAGTGRSPAPRAAGTPAGAAGAAAGAALPLDLDPRILELFPEIGGFLDRRGLYLSGGQKKMVAIARALTLEPKVLLLDEPFEGLAPVVVSRFVEAARRIKALGISLLIAESNLTTASRLADRLYAIDRGEIIFEGTPAEAASHAEVMRTLRG